MTTVDYTALYREDATEDELVVLYQELVNNGQAWMLEGSVGRTAYDLIEQGVIMLGEVGRRDYYGGYVPSRYEVEPGTKGSAEYCAERSEER